MGQLRAVLETVRQHLGGLSTTGKLLIASLCVIVLLLLFLVSQYAARPVMVPLLPGASPEDHARAAETLRAAGIPFQDSAVGLLVPESRRQQAFAVLSERGQQPANTAVVFENILKAQNWMNSREQNRQIYRVMLNNWLSGVLSRFHGIRRAEVFVDVPEPMGLGQGVRRPKASITLFSDTGGPIPQETVDAAARLVAGSVAGLDLDHVVVNDATAGRPRRITTDADVIPSTYREYAAAVERQFKSKIESLLRYIDPPAVVEVTASVDVSRVRAQVSRHLSPGEGTVSLVSRETTSSTVETQAVGSGEPGLRSNAALDVNTGGGRGSRSEQKQEETEFQHAVGTRVEQIDDPRGHPTHIVATVAVPRAFIVRLLREENPPADGQAPPVPTEDEIRRRFERERQTIEQSLRPHVITRTPDGQTVQGEVVVALVSGEMANGRADGASTDAVLGGGWGSLLGASWSGAGSGMVDRVVIGVLALAALGMMFLMVRRAGKRPPVPTSQQLAGTPPPLETGSEVVGEADESETAMPGIEVGEEQIRAVKLREQVSELIRQNPEQAAKLLNRWIAVEQ